MLNQRGIVHIFGLLVLLIGLLVGLYLVQHPAIFKPKATISDPNDTVCIQVITRACKQEDLNFCRDFPNPCDVPEGWTVQPREQIISDVLVDIIIHKSLSDQQKVENWARDIVEDYINKQYEKAGISTRLRIDQIVKNYDEASRCDVPGATTLYDRCEFKDGKLHIWLYQTGFRGGVLQVSTTADPEGAQVYQEVPALIDIETPNYYGIKPIGNILSHEIGHIFTIPDYYLEIVGSNDNSVVPITITPYIKDIMYNQNDYADFSDVSKGYFDRVAKLPAGFGIPHWAAQYTPKETILKIVDGNRMPLAGVKIEIFRQQSESSFARVRGIIPNSVSFEGFTDGNGEYSLGNYDRIFNPPARLISGFSIFLRITNKENIRFTAITRSYLNMVYFRGYQEIVVISVPFASLTSYQPNIYQEISSPPEISLASKSPTPTPPPILPPSSPIPLVCSACSADVDGSGVVDFVDIQRLVACWNKGVDDQDLNGNSCGLANVDNSDVQNIVNFTDIKCLVSQVGQACER